MKYVKDWMSSPIITIMKGKTAQDAAKKMHKREISSIIVVDKNKPKGIITEKDITRIAADNITPSDINVEKIMTKKIISVRSKTPIMSACKLFSEKNIKKLPVIEKGKVIGILCLSDMVKGLSGKYER